MWSGVNASINKIYAFLQLFNIYLLILFYKIFLPFLNTSPLIYTGLYMHFNYFNFYYLSDSSCTSVTTSCTSILITILQKYPFDIFENPILPFLYLYHLFLPSFDHFSSYTRKKFKHHKNSTIISSIYLHQPLSTLHAHHKKKTFSKHIAGCRTRNVFS